ncbi:helix-turn-helix transcriptional regulator, partial [Escherichia coli]|uniref:helix-turn-helix transcriptional regulator n=1 Tax=Escherichia coli TaxID=562 RepID=UPI0021C120CA
GEISVKTGNNARNCGKNSLNRLIRCVCGKKIGPDPRNFNQRVNLGRNDLLIRTFLKKDKITDREMEIIRMTAQGMQPKSIARIENCSVKTVYTHRRNAEAKLYSKIYKLVQ